MNNLLNGKKFDPVDLVQFGWLADCDVIGRPDRNKIIVVIK